MPYPKEKLAVDGGEPTIREELPTWPWFPDDIIQAAMEPLKTGKVNYWTGPLGMEFEKNFAKWCRAQYAIGTSSGTSTLHTALGALNIGPGDEVITVPYTFISGQPGAIGVHNSKWIRKPSVHFLDQLQQWAKGISRVCVVSDASPIAGLPPGRYTTLGNEVVLEESGLLHSPGKGYLAGSSATILNCMNHLASLEFLKLDELLQLGFYNPLRLIKVDPQIIKLESSLYFAAYQEFHSPEAFLALP